MNTWRIVVGDALERLRELDAGSVQTCVTSPPYFGLRDYGTGSWEGGDEVCDHLQGRRGGGVGPSGLQSNKLDSSVKSAKTAAVLDEQVQFREVCGKCGATRTDSQLGLEATPDEYVGRLVEVFREVRRVLRDDGTLWLNLGDSYANQGGHTMLGESSQRQGRSNVVEQHKVNGSIPPGYKQKDLLGIPWMVAFALRADGWYLRSEIIWAKKNCMPESVTDRPTKSHEQVFLLSKQPRYFFDADAVREADSGQDHSRAVLDGQASLEPSNGLASPHQGIRTEEGRNGAGRNIRSVWHIATAPFPGAHFAVFPPKLIEPCVLAGSAEDACGVCGAPWERVTEVKRPEPADLRPKDPRTHLGHSVKSTINQSNWHDDRNPSREVRTLGFEPSCDHQDKDGTSVVLDPLAGAGTTGLVAIRLGRSFIGIELNPEYAKMARERIRDDAPLMNYLLEGAS